MALYSYMEDDEVEKSTIVLSKLLDNCLTPESLTFWLRYFDLSGASVGLSYLCWSFMNVCVTMLLLLDLPCLCVCV